MIIIYSNVGMNRHITVTVSIIGIGVADVFVAFRLVSFLVSYQSNTDSDGNLRIALRENPGKKSAKSW